MITVNEAGIKMLREWLAENHVMSEFSDEEISSWADEAEAHANNGDGCYIELRDFESTWGRVQVFELPESGYDEDEMEGDEK